MIQSFSVPGPLPGANDVLGKKTRWSAGKIKKQCEHTIATCISLAKIKPMRRAAVEYHWFEKDKRRNRDNVMFAAKYINDALVRCKILKNDGWGEITTITHTFTVDKADPRVIVCLIGE